MFHGRCLHVLYKIVTFADKQHISLTDDTTTTRNRGNAAAPRSASVTGRADGERTATGHRRGAGMAAVRSAATRRDGALTPD